MNKFQSHRGYSRTYQENKLTLGLLMPLEAYSGSFARMDLEEQMKLAQKAEKMKFASLFVRDAPLHDPNFGDAGIIYDPWVFLGYLAAHTKDIAIGTSSIVTTLRHPLHTAKAAASLDKLTDSRFLLGLATGDRPIEFPAFNVDQEERGALFRESIEVMRKLWTEDYPKIETEHISMNAGGVIPKPVVNDIPILGTGFSRQPIEWLAQNTDGWLFYPQGIPQQKELIKQWHEAAGGFKPFAQSLTLDLSERPNEMPKQIHAGIRTGRAFLIDYLKAAEEIGVNSVTLFLKYGNRPAEEVIQELGEYVVPHFPALNL